ncbi:DEAD/DEAH box helicase [Microbispora sp. CSR-4]|uniref:DEAD/DEAH box helicase n=1 Tax=Microbispora sp. CSR-4 TaxID=2592813 RepID=UPI00164FE1A1|nr:DEAD/DEAH box helicase [Microbispora sp. CSR-4]
MRVEVFGQLSDHDREWVVRYLNERLSETDLRNLVDELDKPRRGRRKPVETLVVEAERRPGVRGRPPTRLPKHELAEYIVDRYGVSLLEGSERAPVRRALAARATSEELDLLREHRAAESIRGPHGKVVERIAKVTWHAGKSWARHFVKTLGLPAALAGIPGSPQEPSLLVATPFKPLNDLADFQRDLRDQALKVLNGTQGENRAVLTLPTGAGKTRTAVESLVAWLLQHEQDQSPVVLWVAQSEELCEQAVQAFNEVWIDLGHRAALDVHAPLRVARFWGNYEVPKPEERPHVMVASIQKLQSVVKGEDSEAESLSDFRELSRNIGVAVVDEAHRIGAPSYRQVLTFLGVDVSKEGRSSIPLLGLTATPFRSDDTETKNMAQMFHGRLLKAESLGAEPIKELRRRGVLSEVDHRFVEHGQKFDLGSSQKFVDHFNTFHEFHPGFLQSITESQERNKALAEALLTIPEEWPTLFFGCTVEHAEAMSILLRRARRSAAVITADTRAATRRALVEEFRKGRISVLCNYGVLTTGFDAPKVRALVIGRPTTSRVLYAQMIGRGMRGSAFGGTDRCLVIDVKDNIRFHGEQGELAYNKYTDFYK